MLLALILYISCMYCNIRNIHFDRYSTQVNNLLPLETLLIKYTSE